MNTPYTAGFRAGYKGGLAAGEQDGINAMLKVMGEEGFHATALGHLLKLAEEYLATRRATEVDYCE